MSLFPRSPSALRHGGAAHARRVAGGKHRQRKPRALPKAVPIAAKTPFSTAHAVDSPFASVFDAQMQARPAWRFRNQLPIPARRRSAICPAIPMRTPMAMWPFPDQSGGRHGGSDGRDRAAIEANVAAMGAVKDMIQRSIDLLR